MPARKRRSGPPPIDPATLPKRSMTVEEVAIYLRINRKTAWKAVSSGQIPVRRYGRTTRVLLSDLEPGTIPLPTHQEEERDGQHLQTGRRLAAVL